MSYKIRVVLSTNKLNNKVLWKQIDKKKYIIIIKIESEPTG